MYVCMYEIPEPRGFESRSRAPLFAPTNQVRPNPSQTKPNQTKPNQTPPTSPHPFRISHRQRDSNIKTRQHHRPFFFFFLFITRASPASTQPRDRHRTSSKTASPKSHKFQAIAPIDRRPYAPQLFPPRASALPAPHNNAQTAPSRNSILRKGISAQSHTVYDALRLLRPRAGPGKVPQIAQGPAIGGFHQQLDIVRDVIHQFFSQCGAR